MVNRAIGRLIEVGIFLKPEVTLPGYGYHKTGQ